MINHISQSIFLRRSYIKSHHKTDWVQKFPIGLENNPIPSKCVSRLLNQKLATSGNRTRASRVAGENSTTEPTLLDYGHLISIINSIVLKNTVLGRVKTNKTTRLFENCNRI